MNYADFVHMSFTDFNLKIKISTLKSVNDTYIKMTFETYLL